jgi:hypothetical protein
MANVVFFLAIIFSGLAVIAAPEGHLHTSFMGVGIVYALLAIAEEIKRGNPE